MTILEARGISKAYTVGSRKITVLDNALFPLKMVSSAS